MNCSLWSCPVRALHTESVPMPIASRHASMIPLASELLITIIPDSIGWTSNGGMSRRKSVGHS